MKKINSFLLLFFFILLGCKTNQFKNKLKTGKWIFKDTLNEVLYTSKGKYKKGFEIKTWRHFANGICIKKEKYINGLCHTTNYASNGSISSEGKTKLDETSAEAHWYYTGEWVFYDQNKIIIEKRIYNNGELVKVIE